MFVCKYKITLEDMLISSKYVYNSQKRKKDKIIAFLIPILLVSMVTLLIVDIINKKSFVWDIILLSVLVILEIIYLLMPCIIRSSQKKQFKQQNLNEIDYLLIEINNNICIESLFKDEKEIGKTIHNLKRLTSYIEDNNRLVLVFDNIEFTCIRKDALNGDVNKLKSLLEKEMNSKTK